MGYWRAAGDAEALCSPSTCVSLARPGRVEAAEPTWYLTLHGYRDGVRRNDVLSYLAVRDARDSIIAAHQRITRAWWDVDRQHCHLVVSAIVLRESAAGDPAVAAKRLALADGIELLELDRR